MNVRKEHPIFKYVNEGDFVYFVHSYYAEGCDDSLLATTDYGREITTAVAKGKAQKQGRRGQGPKGPDRPAEEGGDAQKHPAAAQGIFLAAEGDGGGMDTAIHLLRSIGNGFGNEKAVTVEDIPSHGKEQSISIRIPPFGGVFFKSWGKIQEKKDEAADKPVKKPAGKTK